MAVLPRQGIAGITPDLDAAMKGLNSRLVLLLRGERLRSVPCKPKPSP